MAKAEGWFGKNGSKWKTMPDLMLRYRAATFFGRLYCPELLMGMKVQEEVIDVLGEPPNAKARPWKPTHGPTLAEIIDAPAEPEAQAEAASGLARVEKKPEPKPEVKQEGASAPQDDLKSLVEFAGYTIDDFKALAEKEGFFPNADSIGNWDEVPLAATKRLMRNPKGILAGIDQMKGGAQ
jgi:hypothetical protein